MIRVIAVVRPRTRRFVRSFDDSRRVVVPVSKCRRPVGAIGVVESIGLDSVDDPVNHDRENRESPQQQFTTTFLFRSIVIVVGPYFERLSCRLFCHWRTKMRNNTKWFLREAE